MFRNAMEKTRRGVVACVFDTSDRIQHMFYRYLRPDGSQDGTSAAEHAGAIEQMYIKMDNLVGLASQYVDEKTVLFVLSDHGFCSFRRGINLNSWLRDNGYLALEDGANESGPYFRGVDWQRTKAYAVGLAGLYLNVKGREAGGIVAPGEEAEVLKRELIQRLANLFDGERNEVGIRTVYATSDLYKGPYAAEAPDLIVGYNDGYRTSWDAAVGRVAANVFEDNDKAWSGDHCVDPTLVPGVFFSNRRVEAENPGIEDMAPTALRLFGLEPPRWMEGKPLCVHAGQ
jgi:predicted AlkP superfamily phosphohydrolase/phosphomutase